MLQALREAADAGHVKIVEGGILEFKPRKDGQITIYTIISVKPGVGTQLFNWLCEYGRERDATFLQAKCPTDLAANEWYRRKGWENAGVEYTKRTGRPLNVWRYPLRRRELF